MHSSGLSLPHCWHTEIGMLCSIVYVSSQRFKSVSLEEWSSLAIRGTLHSSGHHCKSFVCFSGLKELGICESCVFHTLFIGTCSDLL